MTFGLDQCPSCGSKNVIQESYRYDHGTITDDGIETVLVCHDCGRNTDESDSNAN